MNEVYQELAAAIKRRDHALNMLNRWQNIVSDTEADIAKLSNMLVTSEQVTEVPGTVFDQLVADNQSYEQA